MRRRYWVSAIPLFLLASGCSMLPHGPQVEALANQLEISAINDRQNFNDRKLSLSLAAVCDSSVGAVLRLHDDDARMSIFDLCGDNRPPLNVRQLAHLAKILNEMGAF